MGDAERIDRLMAEMSSEEAEAYITAIMRLRSERDAAVRELERVGVELDWLRSSVDLLIREVSEAWRSLVPLAYAGSPAPKED